MISNSSKILDNTTIEYSFNFLKSFHEFTKRFGYVIILDHYLKKENLSFVFHIWFNKKRDNTFLLHRHGNIVATLWTICKVYKWHLRIYKKF